jgi:phosphoserine phosphatase RsbX
MSAEKNLIDWSVAAKPMNDQPISGDLQVVEQSGTNALLAVIDGVGHGPEASVVAQAAADILRKHRSDSVIGLVKRCHDALVRTRGAVMTLASIDTLDNTVTWVGVGNVEARLFRAEADVSHPREHILLRSGLLGLQLPALQASITPIAPRDLLVFATDGIQTGFEASVILTGTPKQIADRVLAQHFKGTDDALVLVARYVGT